MSNTVQHSANMLQVMVPVVGDGTEDKALSVSRTVGKKPFELLQVVYSCHVGVVGESDFNQEGFFGLHRLSTLYSVIRGKFSVLDVLATA